MNLAPGQAFRCPCCGHVLFSIARDGRSIEFRCHKGTPTTLVQVVQFGIVRDPAPQVAGRGPG